MRGAIVLAMVVLLAGCSTPETDPTPSTPTPTDATPTATPEPTTEPTNATPTPPTATPITPSPNATAPVNITIRHDFANASENLTFTIPANAPGDLVVSYQFDTAPTLIPGQHVCSPGLKIKVIRPDGSIHLDVTSSAGSGEGTHCGGVSANAGPAPTDVPPGEWRAVFENTGVGIGWVRVGPASS